MVHRAVADARLLHAADHALERVDVLADVAVQLDVADVAGVRQRVERRFLLDLLERADVVIHRDVEGIRVILAVGHALDLAVALLVDAQEPPGKALGGRREQRPVEAGLPALFVEAFAHVADDLIAELPALLALAVVLAGQRLERFGKADEADGERAVLQHLRDRIVAVELFGIDPHALSHQERVVVRLLAALDLEAVHQLLLDEREPRVEQLVKLFDVALCLDAQPRQVDRGEAQVAAPAGDLARRVVHVAHHARAAAHVRHLAVVIAGLVVLQVERRVEEAEVREQPLRRAAHRVLEQVVVRVALVVIDALLDLEDLHREDRRFAVAEALLGRLEQVADGHAALGRRIGAVVQRAERHLRAGARIHRVQVVDERLHRLLRGVVRLPPGRPRGVLRRVARLLGDDLLKAALALVPRQEFFHAVRIRVGRAHPHVAERRLHGRRQLRRVFVRHAVAHLEILGKRRRVLLAVRLPDAERHRVVEIRHALAAVHLVLVRLNRDAGQRRIAADVLRLAQVAVAGGEAAVEQLDQVDLAAGLGQRIEILVVDVDVAVGVRLRDFRRDDVLVVEALRALGAVLQHRAHRGVGVDVRVFALEVGVLGRLEGEILIDLHELVVHLAQALVLRAVEDVRLRRLGVVRRDQLFLHDVLDLLDRRHAAAAVKLRDDLRGQVVEVGVAHALRNDPDVGLENGVSNFFGVEGDFLSVSFDNVLDHPAPSLSDLFLRHNRRAQPTAAPPFRVPFDYTAFGSACQ